MRRAIFQRNAWGLPSMRDIAAQHLSKTTPTLENSRCIPASPSKAIRRQFSSLGPSTGPTASPFKPLPQSPIKSLIQQTRTSLPSPWRPAISQLRPFNSTSHLRDAPKDDSRQDLIEKEKARREEEEEDLIDEQDGFGRSEKAAKAAQVNLSARLQSSGKQKNSAGFSEIWRLIKIARPEARWLGLAFCFLLVSSAITMSIPFSIGKILDLATKDPAEGSTLFGLELSQFYLALGVVLTMGAAANYGRIIILRIVGERIVARLRSQLYRRTYVQNAEFFDANRVGDLISRLSSDTVIVGKSITQNLSDGLRAIVSGGAGFTAMAWVSLKLTSILCLMFPPVALGAFF